MNFSVCPYCNQSYYNEQSHYCKQNISLEYASRGISNNFENPLQSQNNFHESSSFSIELRNPEVNLYNNIDNLNSGFLRHNQILQDQASLHTNTDNVNEEKSYELPSFKSTFTKSRYHNVNLGTPSELLNRIPAISNQNSSIPHIFHQADTSFAHIKTQNNLEAMQNGCELVDKSSNVEFALKPALVSKQEDALYSQPFSGNITKKGILTIKKSVANIASTVKDTHIPTSANSPIPGSSKVHSKNGPLICEICQRSFMLKETLKRHLLTHKEEQDPKKRSFICEICQRGFMQKEHLERHLLTHTEEQDPKKISFICEICQRGFMQKEHLERHLLTHTEEQDPKERKFICEICQRGFMQKEHLERHLLKHTKEQDPKRNH